MQGGAVFGSHFRRSKYQSTFQDWKVIGCQKVDARCEERPHSHATATQTRHDRYHPKEIMFLKLLTNEDLPKAWKTNAVDHGIARRLDVKSAPQQTLKPASATSQFYQRSQQTFRVKTSATRYFCNNHTVIYSCAMCIGTHCVIWALCLRRLCLVRSEQIIHE